MKSISLVILALCSFVMSSCSFHTAERIADYGREYDCVVLRKDSACWEGYRTSPAVVGRNGVILPETIYFQGGAQHVHASGCQNQTPYDARA